MTSTTLKTQKDQCTQVSEWFCQLRDEICQIFEEIEQEVSSILPAGQFERKTWDRPGGGGGEMSLMKGRVFEKVGVNASTVWGDIPETLKGQMPGSDKSSTFWATGISLVAHPCSPLVPAVHMNTRFIQTSNFWTGGGADMTPYFPFEEDTKDFHAALKEVCDRRGPGVYEEYKQWCDRYFFLKHRNEPRGIGGIFYDHVNSGDFAADFSFAQDVGRAFRDVYSKIVRRRMSLDWTEAQRQYQLERRGRYVEFNLLYDRGTHFGLQTDGNIEAIFMSLPPAVVWA